MIYRNNGNKELFRKLYGETGDQHYLNLYNNGFTVFSDESAMREFVGNLNEYIDDPPEDWDDDNE